MESPFQSIQILQRLLSEASVPSVVIGGVAVGAWGEPRVTRDVDLKVLLSRQDANRLLNLISDDYEPLMEDPYETLRKHALVFVKDSLGTRMVLLWADTPYDVAAIERGREVEVESGIVIRVCSPEDLIIYKLISTRPRDYEDAKSVILRQRGLLDDEYVIGWLRQFEQALDDSTLVATYQRLRA